MGMSSIIEIQKIFREKRKNFNIIKEKCIYFEDILINLYKHLLVSNINIVYDKLDKISSNFYDIYYSIKISTSTKNEFIRIDYIIYKLNKEIESIIINNGSGKLSDILKIVIGKDYGKEVMEDKEFLEFYENVFLPSKYSITNNINDAIIIKGQKSNNIMINTKDKTVVIFGNYINDPLQIFKKNKIIKDKL